MSHSKRDHIKQKQANSSKVFLVKKEGEVQGGNFAFSKCVFEIL